MVALVPLAPLAGKAALALSKGAITRAATRGIVDGTAYWAGTELVAQIAEWARSIDGNWDSQGETPGDGVNPENGCWKMESGTAIYEEASTGNPEDLRPPTGAQCNVLSCTAAIVDRFPESGLNTVSLSRTYADGTSNTTQLTRSESWIWRLNPTCGGGVCSSDPYPNPGGEPLGPINTGPIQSGDCNINTTFYGFLANPDGTGKVEPVFVMEPAAELRANGGVIIGDCNFEPTVVVGGGGDGNEPPRTYPMPPYEPNGDEWWKAIARGAAAGVAEFLVESALEAVFGNQAEASFTLVAPCNKDEEGNPSTYTVEFPSQSYSTRMLAWQVASADLLQQHLNWKTPTCNEQPEPEGEFRTIHFRSASASPNSNSRLRKLFRYRSTSGLGLDEVTEYWKDFTWESGPYRVRHNGSTWGSLEVWAASEDEGKRVIRHAGGEAGIDPDQVGRWSTRRSNSSRLGLSDTMSVHESRGYYMIKIRDGSDGPAFVA
jgi:hypothetical protein